jgi:RNA polymerase sigma factor (sigma-70 family)
MTGRTEQLARRIEQLATASDPASDADLLERFIHERDEVAFAGLVGRYGPMVRLVCLRVLADVHAADDCAQATFLVLARKAAFIRCRESVAAFLHGVACRVARKALAIRYRSRAGDIPDAPEEPADPRPDPLSELTARELLTALDEEVRRLKEVYRLPVVLCCLEGLTLEEAARRLGWTTGSVKGRLERGRKRLHDRLIRRGLTLSAALSAAEVSRAMAAPAPLGASALRTALTLVGGSGAGGISVRAIALADAAFPMRGILKRLMIAVVLLSASVAGAAGVLWQRTVKNPLVGQLSPTGVSAGAREGGADDPEKRVPKDRDDPLPPGALARMGSVRFCPGCTVQSVAFSSDRKTLASGNTDGTVWLWEAATGKQIRILRQSQNWVVAVAFSPDGNILACREQHSGIGLWQPSTGRQIRRCGMEPSKTPPSRTGSDTWAFRLAFSPDGKTLAAGSGDLTAGDSDIRLWAVETGEELRRFRGHKGAVRTFAFAPDGKTLATGGADKTLRLWDPGSARQLHVCRNGGEVFALAWAPDGKTLTTGGKDRMIRVWSTEGKELRRWPVSRMVKSLLFVDARTLAWGDDEGTIHLVEVDTTRERRALARHAYGVSDLCRSPDGKVLASIGEGLDHQIHLWQVDTGKKLSPKEDVIQGRIESVAYSPDGKTLVSTSGDAALRFWDPATGKERRRLQGKFGRMTHAGVFSPDGKTLAVAIDGGATVCLLEPSSGREILRVKNPASGWFTCVAFNPDGKTFLTGGNRFDEGWKGMPCLWDVQTGKELRAFRGHINNVKSVAFSPDGKMVASGGEDSTVRVWETATGKERHLLRGHRHWVESVCFSPNGKLLVSADARSIRFWEPATGKELRALDVGNAISVIALSPDGKTLASGEYDQSAGGSVVRLREASTGKTIRQWTGHRSQVSSLAFSPDGRTLASGGWDTLILVWDVHGE